MAKALRSWRLVFIEPFTEFNADNARNRGYLSHVLVEIDSEHLYPVCFYDAVRLQQDLEEVTSQGRPFIADPGMIVLSEITLATMETAVKALCEEGYFDSLQPIDRQRLVAADPYQWPPR